MSTAQAGVGSGQVYALLADGTTVEIRPAGPDDFGAVKAMHEALSPDNTYLRFFNLSRVAADTEARRICRDPSPDQVALLALSDGEVVGCASYATVGEPGPGRRSGVANILGLNFSGFLAWWLWRTTYLSKLPRLEKKITEIGRAHV